jgi:RNA polymerase sigma-70 factor (ECF subfamily)
MTAKAFSSDLGIGFSSRAAVHPAVKVDERALLALLYRQLRCLAGPRADLDDIVQAAALRTLKSLGSFEGRSEFSTWTFGVCYRTLLDHDRWYARFSRRFSLGAVNGDLDYAAPIEKRSQYDSEARLLEAERALRLYAALDKLPYEKRAVIVLHDLEGLSAPEVAEVIGAKEGTVRSRLRDGRTRLGELLRDDPLFDPGGAL